MPTLTTSFEAPFLTCHQVFSNNKESLTQQNHVIYGPHYIHTVEGDI